MMFKCLDLKVLTFTKLNLRKILHYCNVGDELTYRYFMQGTKWRFCCNSSHSKASRWHCFNFYTFMFTFWLCIGQHGTSTDRKTSESEL